jgi:hypothetical protein
MSATPMEICPLCAMCPRLAGRWRIQVRCSCGARGPSKKSPEEAIGHWNSVVSFVRRFKAHGLAAGWQCGLESDQGCC